MLLEIAGIKGMTMSIVCVGMSGSFIMSKLADGKLSLLSITTTQKIFLSKNCERK